MRDAQLEAIDTLVDVERAVTRLTDRQRAVLALVVEGWTQQRIAEHMGIGQPRVWKHLAAARKKLAKLVWA